MAAASEDNDKNFSKIIIIGAGVAGLSAASQLIKNGVNDFKILEARNKIGGRIEATDTGCNRIELGANYIHGVLGNPIYEFAMAHGLIDIIHIPKPHRVVAALEDGTQVPFPVLQEIYEAYLCFLRRCEEYFLCQYLPPDGINSVGEHITLEASLYLNKITNTEDKHLKSLIFDCLLKRETCITGCDDMNEVDLLELGSYTELQGGNIILPGGFSSILEPLSSIIPPRNILFEHPVAVINWQPKDDLTSPGYDSGIDLLANGDPNNDSDDSDKTVTGGTLTPRKGSTTTSKSEETTVEIMCENGTKLTANHVICTIPLGVLKEKGNNLFQPKLPQYKLDSINRLAFGTVNKIFLEYSRPFLNPNISEVMLLWDTREEDDCDLSKTWFKKIYSFAKVTETLFLGWISGKEARYMETLPSDVIGEKCTELLRKFLNDPYIPLPKLCLCSNWFGQEYFKGSYTSIAVGASQLDIEQIAQPLFTHINQKKPVLLFAGEHTHSNFYSTVHGAYLTGRSAAQSLITTEQPNEIELTCSDTSDLSSWIQGISLDE